MKKILNFLLATILLFSINPPVSAQKDGCNPYTNKDPLGRDCNGAILTAVPFLMINPDARSGAMGDVGIAVSPDANAIYFNASKYALSEKRFGVSLSYTPWLRGLGESEPSMVHGASYFQFGTKTKQVIGVSFRYFALGEFSLIDYNGGCFAPNTRRDFETMVSYSRQLSKNLSIGTTVKFISAASIGYSTKQVAKAAAVDLSMTYKKPLKMAGGNSNLTIGAAIKNIGNKMAYVRDVQFLPQNIGLGAAWDIPFNRHSILIAADLNKLLVPNNATWKNKSAIAGAFGSFSDASGGAQEELKEINYSLGLEYWFDKMFAIRTGYFLENPEKGNRHYWTVGGGVKVNGVSVNVSYLPSISRSRHPLDNTVRFSLVFN